MSQRFDPFDKPIDRLEPGDLAKLRTVSEGWYVEYKKEAPIATALAKSIAAFANTYGGWFFIGIDQLSKENPVAGWFPGIEKKNAAAVVQSLRDGVAANVAPTPHFDVRILEGPVQEIGLGADRVVVVSCVAWGVSAPFVHKDGRIYRRVADSSDPKAENDRFILDQLWRRADDLAKGYERWVQRDPEFSKAESDSPYLRILLTSDPWGDRDLWMGATIEEIREIAASKDGPWATTPFDSVHTTARGFVARQVVNNDPTTLTLTLNVHQDLTCELITQLRWLRVDDVRFISSMLDGYKNVDRFQELLFQKGFRAVGIADLNAVFNTMLGLVNVYEKLNAKAKFSGPWFSKARILNAWRLVPFLDVDGVLDEFEKHGVPVLLEENITSPPGSDPSTFHFVPAYDRPVLENDGPPFSSDARVLLRALNLFSPIARAFGVPGIEACAKEGEEKAYYQLLHEAGIRAIDVQRRGSQNGT